MVDLHFAKPCTFTQANGETRVFAPGLHKDVPPELAEHWFIKAHLAQEAAPAVPETVPLQHEERIQMKAALDAADARARGFEAERDAALSEIDSLRDHLAAERAAHAETRALLDAATAPGADERAPADAAHGAYTVVRGHAGSFKVMKGDEVVAEGLKKADAETRAAELNAGHAG